MLDLFNATFLTLLPCALSGTLVPELPDLRGRTARTEAGSRSRVVEHCVIVVYQGHSAWARISTSASSLLVAGVMIEEVASASRYPHSAKSTYGGSLDCIPESELTLEQDGAEIMHLCAADSSRLCCP